MTDPQSTDRFSAATTICDSSGAILDKNDRTAGASRSGGGRDWIGTIIHDCHPEPARTKTRQLLEVQATSAYTIEKNGVKKLIYQAPQYRDGECARLVELSIPIPFDIPHSIRS